MFSFPFLFFSCVLSVDCEALWPLIVGLMMSSGLASFITFVAPKFTMLSRIARRSVVLPSLSRPILSSRLSLSSRLFSSSSSSDHLASSHASHGAAHPHQPHHAATPYQGPELSGLKTRAVVETLVAFILFRHAKQHGHALERLRHEARVAQQEFNEWEYFYQQSQINMKASLEELGFDSLDRVEVSVHVEREFETEFSDEDFEAIRTPQDIVEFLMWNMNAMPTTVVPPKMKN